MRFRIPILVLLLTLFSSSLASAASYNLDSDHTAVSFRIRHLLSYVRGTFDKFEGKFDFDPDKPETWKASATIQTDSINTRVAQRDKHLRSKDFFDAEKFPTLTFKSTKVTDVTPESAKVEGLLSIHGVEKPVVMDVEIHGVAKDPWGNIRAGFTATTKVNRKDFGLNWNEVLETGKFLVGDEVEITIEVEGIQQP